MLEVATVVVLGLFVVIMVVFFRGDPKPPEPTIRDINDAINRDVEESGAEEGGAVTTAATHHVVIKNRALAEKMEVQSAYVPPEEGDYEPENPPSGHV